MPPLPANDVVNAAVESTSEYLRFLTEQQLGHNRYHATGIQKVAGEELFFDNRRWQVYEGCLPPRLGIQQNSSATFVSDTQPGAPTEIRLVTYDKRTGKTTFAAARESVVDKAGMIIISVWPKTRYRGAGQSGQSSPWSVDWPRMLVAGLNFLWKTSL